MNQITTSTEIAPSAISAATIACGTLATIPKNVVMPMPIANAMYITVSARRGSPPRCAMNSEATIEPTPPAPKTSASWNSVPDIWSATTNGTRVSHGPHTQNRLTIPASRPHFSHGVERT